MGKVIEIDGLSKIYDLGLVGTGTLSRDLNRSWAKFRGKPDPYATIAELNDRTKKSESNIVYALNDINFSVEQGDVLGIVGKNGAGKSTLLKILSEITSPSTGTIKITGRVASLLEVGTGMHPEMTARQNIYLNGSLMGMRRYEISSKLDEIVSFAGIEKYVDTPTKRFSSGMTVRLGFAIAAFLEPEILIVDEVLAVGDAEFQKKAIGKMKEVSSGEGRTVLFVSHNMAAVKSLCSRAILLENGINTFDGTSDMTIKKYLGGTNDVLNFRKFIIDKNGFSIKSFGVKSENKDYTEPIIRTDEIHVIIDYENNSCFDFVHFALKMKGEDGNYFFNTSSSSSIKVKPGLGKATMIIPKLFFNIGNYYIDLLVVGDRKTSFIIEPDCVSFMVSPEPKPIGLYMGKEEGYIRMPLKWEN